MGRDLAGTQAQHFEDLENAEVSGDSMPTTSPGWVTARRHKCSASVVPLVMMISSGDTVQPASTASRASAIRSAGSPIEGSQEFARAGWRRAATASAR